MAYFPRTGDRFNVGAMLAGGSAPVSPGGAVSRPQSQSDAGGRFQALRGFFGANQAAADEKIGTLTAPIEARANEAVGLANESQFLTEAKGGVDKASQATVARDDAKEMLGALGSNSGISGLLGQGDAAYTEGQRSADAALFGRSPGLGEFRSKWEGVLGALEPTYAIPVPLTPPREVPFDGPEGETVPEILRRDRKMGETPARELSAEERARRAKGGASTRANVNR